MHKRKRPDFSLVLIGNPDVLRSLVAVSAKLRLPWALRSPACPKIDDQCQSVDPVHRARLSRRRSEQPRHVSRLKQAHVSSLHPIRCQPHHLAA